MINEFIYGGHSQSAKIGSQVGRVLRVVIIAAISVSAALYWLA